MGEGKHLLGGLSEWLGVREGSRPPGVAAQDHSLPA